MIHLLLQFQGSGIIHAGPHCHGLLGHLNRTQPLLMLLITPVLFLLQYDESKCLLWKRSMVRIGTVPIWTTCQCSFLNTNHAEKYLLTFFLPWKQIKTNLWKLDTHVVCSWFVKCKWRSNMSLLQKLISYLKRCNNKEHRAFQERGEKVTDICKCIHNLTDN